MVFHYSIEPYRITLKGLKDCSIFGSSGPVALHAGSLGCFLAMERRAGSEGRA